MPKFFNIDFDKIYCINLPHRTDRRAHAQQQFDLLSLEVEFVDGMVPDDNMRVSIHGAVNFTPGMIACHKTHHKIYADAWRAGYQRILIFEDDVEFIPGYNYLLDKATNMIPDDAEFLFFGFVQDMGMLNFAHRQNDYWVIPKTGWGCHAYAILGERALQLIHDATGNVVMEIDRQLTTLVLPAIEINYYMMIPPAVKQVDFGTDVQTQKK